MSELQDTMVLVSCALSADVDGAHCFENIGVYHVPKLHGELDFAGDLRVFAEVVGRGRFRLLCW